MVERSSVPYTADELDRLADLEEVIIAEEGSVTVGNIEYLGFLSRRVTSLRILADRARVEQGGE